MFISSACEAGSRHIPNDDYVLSTPNHVVVLDGATANGLPTGCRHNVPWFVSRLAGEVSAALTRHPERSLPDALRSGIVHVRALHGTTCDLDNPDSPSSTVAMVRALDGRLDYLTLADSPVVVELTDGRLVTALDDRVERLPAYDPVSMSKLRNTPEGFWVAGAQPAAADHAVSGSLALASVHRFALLTDGITRLVDRFGWSWRQLLDTIETRGPVAAIAAVRQAECQNAAGTPPGTKLHDDVTIAFGVCHRGTEVRPSPARPRGNEAVGPSDQRS